MKQALLFCLFTILSIPAFSQCVPDETYRDSAIGVYPPPMNDDNPDGGITESACINSGYEFLLTLNIPSEISGVSLDSIVIAPTGAVTNLPIGMSYSCNTPDCVILPQDTLACLRIEGVATDENMPGEYDLQIVATVYTFIGSQELSLPNPLFGGGGNYILTLLDEGNPDCFVTSTNDYISDNIRVTNNPNPFSTTTNIQIYSQIDETLNFQVFDLLGNRVHQDIINVVQGENNIEFDGTHLATGIYTFNMSNQLGSISRKVVVSR